MSVWIAALKQLYLSLEYFINSVDTHWIVYERLRERTAKGRHCGVLIYIGEQKCASDSFYKDQLPVGFI